MKLDAAVLRYLTRDDFRVLTAIEMGMKNHELVPTPLICTIAALSAGPGAAFKIIGTLHRNKLIYHECKSYDGYRLTYLGYDYLALRTYVARGLISGLGRRIGVGKEADIYECCNESGDKMVLKIHRLGRISFRAIKNKRDYLLHRKNASWMYMSRLAAAREYSFLRGLYEHGFPVPTPFDHNRHSILMSFVDAHPFGQIREVSHVGKLYSSLLNLIVKLAEHGLIHADFNEFNLLLSEQEQITLIDFPQMVSTSHPDAEVFFARDVGCITAYFRKRFGYTDGEYPLSLAAVAPPGQGNNLIDLDKELEASGYKGSSATAGGVSEQQRMEFEKYIMGKTDASAASSAASAKQRGDDDDDEDDAAEEQEDEDEDGDDEEAAAAALGVSADDLAASSGAALGEEEAAALARELEQREAGLEQQAAASSSSASASKPKAKKSVKLAAAAAAAEESKQAHSDDEQDEDEDEEEEDEAHRASRMARKEVRKAALQSKQRLQAERKAAEKVRKAAERERASNPAAMAAWQDEQHKAAAAAAAAASVAAASAPASAADSSAAVVADGSDADDAADADADDTRSQASHASAALSALSLGGKGNVLNIKLKPAVSSARVKTTNRNKGRELKKIQMSLKDHM